MFYKITCFSTLYNHKNELPTYGQTTNGQMTNGQSTNGQTTNGQKCDERSNDEWLNRNKYADNITILIYFMFDKEIRQNWYKGGTEAKVFRHLYAK